MIAGKKGYFIMDPNFKESFVSRTFHTKYF